MNYIVMTPGELNLNGLYDFHCDFYVQQKTLNYLGRITVNSGAPGRQFLTTVATEKIGKSHPIPEGEYDLGPLDWAGKPGDYKPLFKDVQSPMWVSVYHRRKIGFHNDGNRRFFPGSAGCPVFKTREDMIKFCVWWKLFGGFQKMYVDYRRGYVKIPANLASLHSKTADSARPEAA